MVEHLIRLGRKRIAYLQGPDDIYNAYQRGLGYRQAMEKFHLFDPSLIVKTGITFKDGADAIDRLIYNKVEFDAIFAFTDTLAIGAQSAPCLGQTSAGRDIRGRFFWHRTIYHRISADYYH